MNIEQGEHSLADKKTRMRGSLQHSSICALGLDTSPLANRIQTLFQRLRTACRGSAVVAVITALLVSCDADLSHSDWASISLRGVGMMLSLCQVLLVLRYHYYRMKVLMRQGKVAATSAWLGLWTHDREYVLLESFLNCIFVPPKFDSSVKYYQLGTYSYMEVDDFLMPFIYLRLYHCLRWGFYMSQFANPRTFFYV